MSAHKRMRFGRYETLFPIGAGGMAEVYAARALGEAGFQKLVALKRILPELTQDPKFVVMFLDEGRVAANITSPNVVSTLDLGRADDGSLYLVMELLRGVPLSQIFDESLARGSLLPAEIAVEIIAQAANGLHDAHEAQGPTGDPLAIVHRDCTPHNILVDVRGQVKITDFGIAKALERQTRSHAGEMKGKLAYMSPEQAQGLPVDRRTDIFILGIVAWELIVGRMLFEAESAVAALHKVVTMDIPRVDELNSVVSHDIAAAISQALQRDPDKRFATAAAFGNAMLNALPGKRPTRSELGDVVRQYGGASLQKMERQLRDASSGAPTPAPEPRRYEVAAFQDPEPTTEREYVIPTTRALASSESLPDVAATTLPSSTPHHPQPVQPFGPTDPALPIEPPSATREEAVTQTLTRPRSETPELILAPTEADDSVTDETPSSSRDSAAVTQYFPRSSSRPPSKPRRPAARSRLLLVTLALVVMAGLTGGALVWFVRSGSTDESVRAAPPVAEEASTRPAEPVPPTPAPAPAVLGGSAEVSSPTRINDPPSDAQDTRRAERRARQRRSRSTGSIRPTPTPSARTSSPAATPAVSPATTAGDVNDAIEEIPWDD